MPNKFALNANWGTSGNEWLHYEPKLTASLNRPHGVRTCGTQNSSFVASLNKGTVCDLAKLLKVKRAVEQLPQQ